MEFDSVLSQIARSHWTPKFDFEASREYAWLSEAYHDAVEWLLELEGYLTLFLDADFDFYFWSEQLWDDYDQARKRYLPGPERETTDLSCDDFEHEWQWEWLSPVFALAEEHLQLYRRMISGALFTTSVEKDGFGWAFSVAMSYSNYDVVALFLTATERSLGFPPDHRNLSEEEREAREALDLEVEKAAEPPASAN